MMRLRIGAICATLIACLVSMGTTHGQHNVVVIITDDAGWADYGFMRDATSDADPGNRGAVPTPNLDALASRGVTFTNAYTGSVCSPSRAMITTGMYGTRFGYGSNILSNNSAINTTNIPQGLPTEAVTVWERMQSVGYKTAAVGKWHIGAHSSGGGQLGNRPEHQGVEFFQGLWSGSRNYNVGGVTGDGQLRETISDGQGGISSNSVIEDDFAGQYVTDVFGDQSADYIRANAGGQDPFFLYTSFTAPHTPIQATAADLAFIDSLNEPGFTGQRRTYAAMQYAMDRNIGKILAALEDPNGNGNTNDSIAENTLVMFINDNGGDSSDSQPNFSDNGALRNGKGSQFEGGMRVPMIVAGAGVDQAKRNTVSSDLVHSVDIVPTALIGAGGGAFGNNEVIDGVNLLPYINGTAAGVAHDNLFISRFNNQQSAVRMGQWKYMYQNGTGYQLYDLDNDIGESNNVVNEPANEAVVKQAHQLLASYHVEMDKPRHDNQADDTNQFDHFRFREGAFTTASFSTANAWTNGDSNTGNFTASWRDGYANNELTFRTKAAGDYTVTNDLDAAAGLPYMASKLNLESQANPVTAARKATITGLPLLLTSNLSGDAPVINLHANEQTPDTFTFDVDLDIELYDDLTIQGNGNQKFSLNGAIREFRPGRSITKTGTANLTVGGPIEVTGTVDLQGGKVSLIDGNVGGSLVARTATTITVGGAGFNRGEATPPTFAPIVTTGLDLHFNADLDSPGDATWDDSSDPASNVPFSGPATPISISDPTFQGITKAYDIASTGGTNGLSNYFEGGNQRSRQDATFEVWFRVDDTSAGGNQVIFEAGAGRGISFTLDDDTLNFNVQGDDALQTISQTLGTGWHQAVGLIDLVGNSDNAPNDSITLYVNNALVGTLNNVWIDDWAGGNNLGIGDDAAGTAGGSGIQYHGPIAVARYYRNYLFDANDVDFNYQAAQQDPGGSESILPTVLTVAGDYTQETGAVLELDLLDADSFDRVAIAGSAQLAGQLVVSGLANFEIELGDDYSVLTAGSISGTFDDVQLPTLEANQMWQVSYDSSSVSLLVTVAGDYNGDGIVNLADYTVWRNSLGQSVSPLTSADGNGDGIVTAADYATWKTNFGSQIPVGELNSNTSVPEPSSVCIAILSLLLIKCRAL